MREFDLTEAKQAVRDAIDAVDNGLEALERIRQELLAGVHVTCSTCSVTVMSGQHGQRPWTCPDCELDARLADLSRTARVGDRGFIRHSDDGIYTVVDVDDIGVVLANGTSAKHDDFIVTGRGGF